MKKLIKTAIALLLTTHLSYAGPVEEVRSDYNAKDLNESIMSQDMKEVETSPLYFKDDEFSFDIFGTYSGMDGRGSYGSGFGGGMGFNYFFSRYMGIGLNSYWWDGGDGPSDPDIVHNIEGNLFLRFPIEEIQLAPYIFGGPGGHFGPVTQVDGHIGGGLEYRFTEDVGIFADGQYVFADETQNYALARFGIKFIF